MYPNIQSQSIRWNSFDGKEIEGLLTYPADFQENLKYPLLLIIHGAPWVFLMKRILDLPLHIH